MELTPIVLDGAVVRLEPLTPEHLPGLCAVGLDAELWRWTAAVVRTPDEMAAYVETALAWQRERHCLPFATIDRASGRVVGTTRFGNFDGGHRRVEIGWTFVAPAWQRTPINTEAKFLMFHHAFEALGLNRVELKTDVRNEASRRAIRRVGAKEEGILRSHVVTATGRIRDTVFHSVIREEWPEVRERLLGLLARR